MTATSQTYTERFLPIAGGQMHLLQGGAGPPLLILHHDIGNPGWPLTERPLRSQGLQCAVKAEFSLAESGFQIRNEFGAEQTAEHLDRKEKLPATRNPVALVGRDPAARNQKMNMRMVAPTPTIP